MIKTVPIMPKLIKKAARAVVKIADRPTAANRLASQVLSRHAGKIGPMQPNAPDSHSTSASATPPNAATDSGRPGQTESGLSTATGGPSSSRGAPDLGNASWLDMASRAVGLAGDLLKASRQHETSAERARTAQMARMMRDEAGKKFTILMTDQVLKIADPAQAAERLNAIIQRWGLPRYLNPVQRTLLWAGHQLARVAPGVVMPLINRQVRRESAHVIVSENRSKFDRYVQLRREHQWRINFNQLGEAVLGDSEAERRFQAYLNRLKSKDINYVSVKLSSIVSQISLTGYEDTLAVIKPRLRSLYRAAMQTDGAPPKFVNLDMEEYRDLQLTVDVFCQVLDEPEFQSLEAGIVLQAYLPDSFPMQQYLTKWALKRKAAGGAGIKIRLVKGANLAMEQVEASLRGWPQAPYHTKRQVDANYKRMLDYAMQPAHAAAVRLGVASHNLFEIAFAMLLRQQRSVQDRVEFEMLEGMANAQATEVRQRTGGLVVYTPAVPDEEFEAAVAYLVRRLDENTAPGSFLGALFALEQGSPEWNEQRDAFIAACGIASLSSLEQFDVIMEGTSSTESDRGLKRIFDANGVTREEVMGFLRPSNRLQNRFSHQYVPRDVTAPFANEPDTDFALQENRRWATHYIQTWRQRPIPTLDLHIGTQKIQKDPTGIGRDPSCHSQEIYRFVEAGPDEVEGALQVAVEAQTRWRQLSLRERGAILVKVAEVFAASRGETLGAMMVDCGKAFTEGDVEISEAIDFANYYARWWQPRRPADPHGEPLDFSALCQQSGWFDGTAMEPLGVVVVAPPWNFPFAIPAGGCLAALMAGNAVILKPSPEAVLTAYQLACQFWEAGVPRDVLQFLPLDEQAAGTQLITDPRTAAVILTGSSETADLFLRWRPQLRLMAETSGKNAMIITAFADLDLAVKDLVRGAFGHSGQKCSATSLALVERSVYESEKFRHQLIDAARSLHVGSSHDPSSVITPVIRTPDPGLERGLTTLEPGESWLLEPRMIDNNPCLWSPGIRLGVRPGSWYHRTECFGPVLGLVCVDSLSEAIEIANSSAFGLTGGLHSLDPAQIRQWRESIEVGNAYINRGTTGAIVQRQPFGGWKNSSVGSGAKAGGPNYVASFARWRQESHPEWRSEPLGPLRKRLAELRDWLPEAEHPLLEAAAGSYQYWWNQEFSLEHDPSQIHGETNHFRYLPRPLHVLRIADPQSVACQLGVALASLAAARAGTPLEVSVPVSTPALEHWREHGLGALIVEPLETMQDRVGQAMGATVRLLDSGDESGAITAVAHREGTEASRLDPLRMGKAYVAHGLPLCNGRLELQLYLREQAISETVHRYGNLIG